jgi:hypothetical protein
MRNEQEPEPCSAFPRSRVLRLAVVVSGGVGDPVGVELEDAVGRCYQPPL